MCIRQPYPADEEGEELPPEEREPAEQGHIAVCLDDEPGTEDDIERWVFSEGLDEIPYILDMVLSVRIESHDVAYTQFLSIPADIFEPGLERRTPSTIERMMHDMNGRELWKHLQGVVLRAVIHHEDMSESGTQNRPNDRCDTGCFIIGPYQENNLRRFYKMRTSRSNLHFLVHRTTSYDSLRYSIFKRISSFSRNFCFFIYGHADGVYLLKHLFPERAEWYPHDSFLTWSKEGGRNKKGRRYSRTRARPLPAEGRKDAPFYRVYLEKQ